VKLLFDQNLSRHLVGQVRDVFPDSEHVAALDLDSATSTGRADDQGDNEVDVGFGVGVSLGIQGSWRIG
jgi:hypothetical protein